MWERIVEIAKTASAMLHSGEVPPNTPDRYAKDLSKINFLASKKFYVVFCSVIILAIFYAASIVVLFLTAASPSLTVPFVSIFTETIKILAIIIASYLGVQTILDYKMQSNNNTSLEDVSMEENIDEKIILDFAAKYKEDPSYAPLDWVNKK
jgi:hypothetical protein